MSSFLFDSLDDFFDSKMWTGDRSYGQIPLKRWFGWLYIAGFNAFELDDMMDQTSSRICYKIGYSYNLTQRSKDLQREKKQELNGSDVELDEQEVSEEASSEEESDQEKSKKGPKNFSKQIYYAFSVPSAKVFETKVLRVLSSFIHKDFITQKHGKVSGASEIIVGLPIEPLVHIMQLCILSICLEKRFLPSPNDDLQDALTAALKSPPDIIIYKNKKYYGRRNGENSRHVFKFGNDVIGTLRNITGVEIEDRHPFNLHGHFRQYVFNVEVDDQTTVNSAFEDISTEITEIKQSRSSLTNPAPIGACFFANYGGGQYPCEVIGYQGKNYIVRWIDNRRLNTTDNKWVQNDQPGMLGDFLRSSKDGKTGEYRGALQREDNSLGDPDNIDIHQDGFVELQRTVKTPSELSNWYYIYKNKVWPDRASNPQSKWSFTARSGESPQQLIVLSSDDEEEEEEEEEEAAEAAAEAAAEENFQTMKKYPTQAAGTEKTKKGCYFTTNAGNVYIQKHRKSSKKTNIEKARKDGWVLPNDNTK